MMEQKKIDSLSLDEKLLNNMLGPILYYWNSIIIKKKKNDEGYHVDRLVELKILSHFMRTGRMSTSA